MMKSWNPQQRLRALNILLVDRDEVSLHWEAKHRIPSIFLSPGMFVLRWNPQRGQLFTFIQQYMLPWERKRYKCMQAESYKK